MMRLLRTLAAAPALAFCACAADAANLVVPPGFIGAPMLAPGAALANLGFTPPNLGNANTWNAAQTFAPSSGTPALNLGTGFGSTGVFNLGAANAGFYETQTISGPTTLDANRAYIINKGVGSNSQETGWDFIQQQGANNGNTGCVIESDCAKSGSNALVAQLIYNGPTYPNQNLNETGASPRMIVLGPVAGSATTLAANATSGASTISVAAPPQVTAAASWAANATSITTGANPGGVGAGAIAYDATIGHTVGVVASYVGTALTLRSGATFAASTSADVIVFNAITAGPTAYQVGDTIVLTDNNGNAVYEQVASLPTGTGPYTVGITPNYPSAAAAANSGNAVTVYREELDAENPTVNTPYGAVNINVLLGIDITDNFTNGNAFYHGGLSIHNVSTKHGDISDCGLCINAAGGAVGYNQGIYFDNAGHGPPVTASTGALLKTSANPTYPWTIGSGISMVGPTIAGNAFEFSSAGMGAATDYWTGAGALKASGAITSGGTFSGLNGLIQTGAYGLQSLGGTVAALQQLGTNNQGRAALSAGWGASGGALFQHVYYISRNAAPGGLTSVQANDEVRFMRALADDGATAGGVEYARLSATVEAVAGTNQIAGELQFYTATTGNPGVETRALLLDDAQKATFAAAVAITGTLTTGTATLLSTSVSLTNGAAAATATLTNAPSAGNPTKWIPINDNGTTRYVPAW